MRTREMGYADHGITEDEKQYIFDFCRSADEEQKKIIKEALSTAVGPYISPYVFRSLTENMSYDDICKEDYIYMQCVDFYAYRRKGMAAIKRWMQLYGLWNI